MGARSATLALAVGARRLGWANPSEGAVELRPQSGPAVNF